MTAPRPTPTRQRLTMLCLLASLMVAACGGGGSAVPASAVSPSPTVAAKAAAGATAAVVISPVGAADAGGALVALAEAAATALAPTPPTVAASAAAPAVAAGAAAEVANAATSAAAPPASPASVPAPAELPPLAAPTLPRSGLTAGELAILVAEGDALGEAIARLYQQARGIPDGHVIRVPVPAGGDAISDSDFATLKADIDARLPADVQATLVTWTRPSRVQGSSCAMGITSALAFGYNAALCGGCGRTQPSAYYDLDTTRPWSDLRIRPSMMLGASTLAAAQALIARGVAADASDPTGSGWLVRTADAARSARWPDFSAVPAAWTTTPAPILRYLDASTRGWSQEVVGYADLLFYFTGTARLQQLQTNRFLPGAVGDHLTSFGGYLPDAKGQMPATDWLAAGATASYGTVEEPCNHVEKFPRASVMIDHYLRGATVLEAYWKSVAWPGQGLFVGEPLARPWANEPQATIEGSDLVVRSRALRRGGAYRVDWLAAGSAQWRTLASLTAGQPRPLTWRVPLPADAAGSRLRWVGPCPLRPTQACVLGGG